MINVPLAAQDSLLLLFEGFLLIGLLIYLVFALVVIRQTNQMTQTLEVGFESPIKALAWLHLLFALSTFVLAFMLI